MKSQDEILALIRAGIMPALGCTEPGAVALAAAYARKALGGEEAVSLKMNVDSNVYKNGLAVGVPGTGMVGLPIAAALGMLIGQPELQLAVLSRLDEELLAAAKNLMAQGIIDIALNDRQGLYIEALLTDKQGHTARAIIAGTHTNLVSLELDGIPVVCESGNGVKAAGKPDFQNTSLAELIQSVEAIPPVKLFFLLECVNMNLAAAREGLDGRMGMAVGAHLNDLVAESMLADDLVTYAKVLTAAGADARMSGENIPVMSVAGSGNHGLTAILPIVAVAERQNIPEEQLCRALAISIVTTMYIKNYTGSLSALCGCAVAAATAASAAIAWMLGGSMEQIQGSVKNMIANLTGMICDGGKVGCALKLATAAGTAVETALLTMRDVVVPCSNGIIFPSTDATIRSLGKVSNPGMLETDKIILDIMLEKGRVQAEG